MYNHFMSGLEQNSDLKGVDMNFIMVLVRTIIFDESFLIGSTLLLNNWLIFFLSHLRILKIFNFSVSLAASPENFLAAFWMIFFYTL